MATKYFDDPYRRCNCWLFPRLESYSHWESEDFDNVLARLTGLPNPDTNWKRDRLKESKLDQTLPNLARKIGKSAAHKGSQPDPSRDRIVKLWQACRQLAACFEGRAWGSFANAAGELGQADLLDQMWKAWLVSGVKLEPAGWGSFANAAGELGQADLLDQMWKAWLVSGVKLEPASWGSFANAAGELGQADLLDQIWKAWLASGVNLESAGWGSFVNAAGDTKQPELLMEIFNAWRPQPDTLLRMEHGIWTLFFSMAFRLDQEPLILEIFHRLEFLVDPIRFRNWRSIGPLVRGIASQLKNKDLANEITLRGLRLDTARCFTTFETAEPSRDYGGVGDKPFEGAGRCLMHWLINSYFFCDYDEFLARLSLLIDGLLSLKVNQKRAWHALFCRGQETYSGCLKARWIRPLKERLSFIDSLNDDELLTEIKEGHVTERLKEFLCDGVERVGLPQPAPDVTAGAPARSLEPLIEHLWSNQADFLNRKLGDKDFFFGRATELLDEANIERFTKEDWIDFIRLLLNTMSNNIWDSLIEPFKDQIHTLKGDFEDEFQNPLKGTKLTDEGTQQRVQLAREFIKKLAELPAGFRFGEVKSVNIAGDVWKCLIKGRHDRPTTTNEITWPRFTTAAWDGARKDLLIPMLKEIRLNAETALNKLPPELQTYHVSLKNGEREDSQFGILIVSNAYKDDKSRPHSTKRGRGIVQRLASLLGGSAIYSTGKRDDGQILFTWVIRLPRVRLDESNVKD
jgi:hypothetical protein